MTDRPPTPDLPKPESLYAEHADPGHEQFFELLRVPGLRLERIVSHGRSSAPGQWYEQSDPEWVLLARGEAELEFGRGRKMRLKAGEHLLIPAGLRHRVSSCSTDAVWLALHWSGDAKIDR